MDGAKPESVIDRPVVRRRYRVAFAFCGIGGGALGFKWAVARLARLGLEACFDIVGGIESDPSTARDFERLTGAPCLVAKVEELTVERLRAFFGDIDVWVFSPPCKPASGLLPPELAATEKYQTMGMLGSVWVDLMFLAWPRGPRLMIMENVPQIRTKFPQMLEQIRRTCRKHKFHIHEDLHDLGELGALAQHRNRLLFVARRHDVTTLLYQPVKRSVRSIGEVLSQLPLPGDPSAGRLHQLPKIEAITALRLALIPAGGDWRNLPAQVHLHPAFAALMGKRGRRKAGPSDRTPFNDTWRVVPWDAAAGCVTGGSTPSAGGMSIADPRLGRANEARGDDHGVIGWGDPSGTITTRGAPSNGRFSVADPRTLKASHPHTYGVVPWDRPSHTITGNAFPGGGPFSVADPRVTCKARENSGIYGVVPWGEPSGTIVAHACHDNGRFSVADPRPASKPRFGNNWRVEDWQEPAHTITGSSDIQEGAPSVNDARPVVHSPFPVILAADGTWHRPMSLLERALLQGFPATWEGEPFDLEGPAAAVSIKIGDAMPPLATEPMAVQFLYTLLLADADSFALSGGGAVWVDGPSQEASLQ